MPPPPAPKPKTYFIQKDGAETGPFTLVALNQMRARGEISGNDLARNADSPALKPLASIFPHMGDFVRKSPEEQKKFARVIEGNFQARVSLACAAGSFVIAAPVLSAFAIVYGIRSAMRVTNYMALAGVALGSLSFVIAVFRIIRPYLHLE